MPTPKRNTQPTADISAMPAPDPAQMAAEIADLGLECEGLKTDLTTAKQALRDMQRERDDLQKHAAAQVVKLAEKRNELLIAIEDRDYAQRQTASLQTEVAKLTAELVEAKRDNALIMAELGDVARQRDAASVAAQNAQASLDEWEAHPFFGVIHQLNKQCGEISAELVEHTDKVIAGANDTGKPGKVTLTIAIKPSEEHAKAMIAAAKVTSTMPKADPAKAVFFMQAGKITADDPQQPKLPLTGAQGRRPAPTEADRELERRLAAATGLPVWRGKLE